MKILYHHRIRSKDGQSVHLEELIAALRALGNDVLIVGPGDIADESFGHDPKALNRLKRMLPASIYEMLELCYNVPAYFRIRRAYNNFLPDFVYERNNLYLLAGIFLKMRTGVPLLLEVNAPLARERKNFGGLGLRGLAERLEQWVWQSADAVLPVTRVLANEMVAAGVARERVEIVPNGIDHRKFAKDDFDVKQELHLTGKTVLGFTGFVRDWHGLDGIINLLSRHDVPESLHFLVVGDGPAVADLKNQAKVNGVTDRVTFAGLIERDKIARYVSAFDIALLPKCVEYCSPLKLFEYMALGKAIIAPDQANIREVLTHQKSAVLFSSTVPGAMSDAILRVAADDGLRRKLGENAESLVELQGYTWHHNAERITKIGSAKVLQHNENL